MITSYKKHVTFSDNADNGSTDLQQNCSLQNQRKPTLAKKLNKNSSHHTNQSGSSELHHFITNRSSFRCAGVNRPEYKFKNGSIF